MQPSIYQTIGLGGTFDHFHDGHADFIKFAASLGKKLLIGVTNQKMTLHKPYFQLIESHPTRKKNLEKFCRENNINAEIITINDPYGPTLDNASIKALAATKDTENGAKNINNLRQKMGLAEFPIHIRQLLKAQDGKPLRSERIRAGECSRHGVIYSKIFDSDLKLSSYQKGFFSEIQGKTIKKINQKNKLICVVGDTTLELFIENNWPYQLGIYDLKKQRQKIDSKIIKKIKPDQIAPNPAGQISVELINQLQAWKQKPYQHLFINGEEDLATVALVFLLPLNSYIYYGQPGHGLIELRVTQALKELFHDNLTNKKL